MLNNLFSVVDMWRDSGVVVVATVTMWEVCVCRGGRLSTRPRDCSGALIRLTVIHASLKVIHSGG